MNECRFCHVIYEELRDKIKCETKHLEDQNKQSIKKEDKPKPVLKTMDKWF